MTRTRKLVATAILLLFSLLASAQTTKIRGRVFDLDTREPIPFAGVFFKGTTVGMTADLDGAYNIEIRDTSVNTVVCQLLGYDTVEKKFVPGSFYTMDFYMKLTDNLLTGAVVKADNKRVRALLKNIEDNRERNNPDNREFTTETYNKMEIDLSRPREHLNGKRFMKEFGFIYDYLDTSVVSGVPYLPILISESVSQRAHSVNPKQDREKIEANRISGVDPDNNLLSQFSGSLYLKGNFYQDYINVFSIEFPSPAQEGGLFFYKYFIIDSLQIDGHKNYLVRFHPNSLTGTGAALDGEMYIDTEDWALRSVHAKMARGGNVNWVRDLVIDADYEYSKEDSCWFYKSEKLYADFSLALTDSSKLMSFLGTRTTEYSKTDFHLIQNDILDSRVKVRNDAGHKDDAYWDEKRPYELSEKEQGIYDMVDAIKDQPLYEDLYTSVYTLLTGYLDIGPVGIGPYFKIISFNELEGFRPQLGIHTSKELSRINRFTVFGAYGTRDKEFKGGVTWEHMFSKDPWSKLTLDAHYDIYQLGRGTSEFTEGNILSSLWQGRRKMSPISSYSATFTHEFSQGFVLTADLNLKRHFSNSFVPMSDWNGNPVRSVAANQLHVQARFSRDETVNRGHFIKRYVQTKHPVWMFDLTGSVPGIRPGDCGFFKPEVTMNWKFHIPPAGISRLNINAGTILGQVPYPFLHIHAGNATGLLDRSSFSCMDMFEFASDSWVTLMYDHNFGGFFFNKIPWFKQLKLREVVIARAAWGYLSDKNNGTDASYGALMPFPEGMRPLTVPYVEAGFGVSNIFRLVRIDAIWRLTNLDNPNCRRFVINFGLDFKF